MASDFFDRVKELQDNVGHGKLQGRVSFGEDSPAGAYAWNQHEMRWINFLGYRGPHPITEYHGGGGAKFLEGPMLAQAPAVMQEMADRIFEPDGLHDAMDDGMKNVAEAAVDAAPMRDGTLRESVKYSVSGE